MFLTIGTHYYFQFQQDISIMIFHILCTIVRGWSDLELKAQKAAKESRKRNSIITSLSCAISWVFTWPDTRFTRPNTCPVSSPQMVQVVSMLEVPGNNQCTSVADRSEASPLCLLLCVAQEATCHRYLPASKSQVFNPYPRTLDSADWRDKIYTHGKLSSTWGINNHIPYLASFPLAHFRLMHGPQARC